MDANGFDKAKAIAKINSKITDNKCPYCKNNDYTVPDSLGVVSTTPDGSNIMLDKYWPMVALTCNKCGHTALFNYVVLMKE